MSAIIYYIIYKTINLTNNKFYIGKHKQLTDPYSFDGYLGSGTHLKHAIRKYGKENFTRVTLFVFLNEEKCYIKENELSKQWLNDPLCYNIKEGGLGGFEHINNNPELNALRQAASREAIRKKQQDPNYINFSQTEKGRNIISQRNTYLAKNKLGPYSVESIERRKTAFLRKAGGGPIGSKNGAFGSKTYINLETQEKKKFLRTELIPNGWVPSLEYQESKKETHWYNDGITNFLLKKDNPKTESLIRGRIRNRQPQ